ncbi:MAG: FHA domain-containing protein [Myxococcota bacterium]
MKEPDGRIDRQPIIFRVLTPGDEESALEPGMVLQLEGGPAVLGRSEVADLCLPDPTVSRRHARITIEGGKLVVERLTSDNGLYVDDVEVGDRTTCGLATARLQLGGLLLAMHLPRLSNDRTTKKVRAPIGALETPNPAEPRWTVQWDAQTCIVSLDGRALDLEPLPSAFLGALLESPDTGIQTDDLAERVGRRSPNLSQCASEVRQALRKRVDAGQIRPTTLVASIRAVYDGDFDETDLTVVLRLLIGNLRSYGYIGRVGHMGVQIDYR